MSNLQESIQKDILISMRNKDELKLSVLRMAKTLITNKEKEKKSPLDDSAIVQILNTMVKQRKDSIEQFTKGNRPELAQKESEEIKIIEEYLPSEISLEETKTMVDSIVESLSKEKEVTPKDIGVVMKICNTHLAVFGKRADGKVLSSIIKEKLNNVIIPR